MDLHLARMLKQQGHSDMQDSSRILEINSSHQLIIKLSEISQDLSKKDLLGDVAHLLLDQAKITEGEAIKDPANFAKRLNETLVKVLI